MNINNNYFCIYVYMHCLLPIVYFLFPVAYCLFPVAYFLFPVAYCLLSMQEGRGLHLQGQASSAAVQPGL